VRLDLGLADAQFNEAAGADLSRLQFEVGAAWPGYSSERSIVVASTKTIKRQKLELGLCAVEVEPVFDKPYISAGRATSKREWTTRGAYKVTLRDEAGKLMDQTIIGYVDESIQTSKEYTRLSVPRGEYGGRTDIFEGHPKTFIGVDPLFSYEVVNSGNDKRTAIDPKGNMFSYVFPHASVRVYPLELMKQHRAERLAMRKVRYGWWESKDGAARNDDWGYAERPTSFAGGGGGGGCSG
jgi:hypothetical protein